MCNVRYGAVIIADNVASRMGKMRAMLPMADESIIGRTIRLLKRQGTERIVVVTGYRNEIIEEHLEGTGVVCVYNEAFVSCSSYASYGVGISRLLADGEVFDRIFLLRGGDPVLCEDTFAAMAGCRAGIVVTRFLNDRGKPLLIGREELEAVTELMSAGDPDGAREYFEARAQEIDVDDEGVVISIDTKQDYEMLLELFYAKSGRRASLRMELDLRIGTEELFFDNDTALFLELIAVTGSISAACHAMNISYTKGWKLINKVEEKFGRKIISRNVGGSDGGGCALTGSGRYLLNSYKYMQRELSNISNKIFKEIFTQKSAS